MAVDFGTSTGLARLRDADGNVSTLEIGRPEEGHRHLLPMVVGEIAGAVAVGEKAARDPRSLVSLKTHITDGTRVLREDEQATADPALLSGTVDGYLAALASEILSRASAASNGLSDQAGEIVLSCPSSWDRDRRERLIEVFRSAGAGDRVSLAKTVDEAVAAGVSAGPQLPDGPGVLLVFDLGGGTTDVAMLEYRSGRTRDSSPASREWRVLSAIGSHTEQPLGGDELDSRLLAHLVRVNPGLKVDRVDVREAKESLYARGDQQSVRVGTSRVELTRDLVEKTLEGLLTEILDRLAGPAFQRAALSFETVEGFDGVGHYGQSTYQVRRRPGEARELIPMTGWFAKRLSVGDFPLRSAAQGVSPKLLVVGGLANIPFVPAFLAERIGIAPEDVVSATAAVTPQEAIVVGLMELAADRDSALSLHLPSIEVVFEAEDGEAETIFRAYESAFPGKPERRGEFAPIELTQHSYEVLTGGPNPGETWVAPRNGALVARFPGGGDAPLVDRRTGQIPAEPIRLTVGDRVKLYPFGVLAVTSPRTGETDDYGTPLWDGSAALVTARG